MEPNKFATMLHRKTNRVTFVLVYAVLEWALIFFLLLNSLFSYLIVKFAHYFGLKPPCLLCSRIDHILEPHNSGSCYRGLICEQHGIELSKSGYCVNHRKLVESQDMCEDCSSSHPDVWSPVSVSRWLKGAGTVKSGGDRRVVENGEVILRCSCCGVTINSKTLSTHVVIRPSLEVLEDTQKGNLISGDGHVDDTDLDGELGRSRTGLLNIKGGDGNGIESSKDVQMGNSEENWEGFSFCLSNGGFSIVEAHGDEGDVVLEAKTEPLLEGSTVAIRGPYANEKILPQHLEFYIDRDDLIPVELVNLEVEKSAGEQKAIHVWRETDDELVFEPDMAVAPAGLYGEGNLDSSCLDLINSDEHKIEDVSARQGQEEEIKIENGTVRLDETKSEDLPTKQDQEEELIRQVDGSAKSEETAIEDLLREQGQQEEIKREVDDAVEVDECKDEKRPLIQDQAEETKTDVDLEVAGDRAPDDALSASDDQATEEREVTELDVNISSREVCHKRSDEIHVVDCDELIDKIQVVKPSTYCKEGPTTDVIYEASTTTPGLPGNGDDESKKTEEKRENLVDIIVEINKHELKSDGALSHEPNEIEEDRIPDTPTSIDSLQHLHRKLGLLGGRESTNEESLDESILNELKGSNGEMTIEELKSELRAERKAFRALYAELEEERNAAAVAVSETMSMINRLQEEKSTIEMEALQYQRMMEEQAEYDQEALQVMNEILVKRETEKEELERELEVYRKKVMDYEERERTRVLNERKEGNCTRSRTSSESCSNGEESDGLSVDLNNDSREEDGLCRCEANGHHDIPADVILNLKESLSGFEEERISILEQLRVLEEKLCTLAEEEEHQIRNMKPFEQFYEYNAEDFSKSFKLNGDANGLENGSSNMNGEYHQDRRMNGSKPKQHHSLFDSAALESDNKLLDRVEDRLDPFLLDELPLAKFELGKRRFTIEEEVEHVYERLQALEADREFVKHCISSLRKGDKGIDLLQEILQHLRDLKNVEFRARNVDGVY